MHGWFLWGWLPKCWPDGKAGWWLWLDGTGGIGVLAVACLVGCLFAWLFGRSLRDFLFLDEKLCQWSVCILLCYSLLLLLFQSFLFLFLSSLLLSLSFLSLFLLLFFSFLFLFLSFLFLFLSFLLLFLLPFLLYLRVALLLLTSITRIHNTILLLCFLIFPLPLFRRLIFLLRLFFFLINFLSALFTLFLNLPFLLNRWLLLLRQYRLLNNRSHLHNSFRLHSFNLLDKIIKFFLLFWIVTIMLKRRHDRLGISLINLIIILQVFCQPFCRSVIKPIVFSPLVNLTYIKIFF